MERKIERFRKDLLSLKTVGMDSMIFIYQFADHSSYGVLTNILFELLDKGHIQAVSSTISAIEVFIHPEREKESFIIAEYERVFQNLPHFTMVPLDWHVARLASKIRAAYPKIKTPDTIQLATALITKCAGFVTNDTQLKQVKELKMLVLKEYLS